MPISREVSDSERFKKREYPCDWFDGVEYCPWDGACVPCYCIGEDADITFCPLPIPFPVHDGEPVEGDEGEDEGEPVEGEHI